MNRDLFGKDLAPIRDQLKIRVCDFNQLFVYQFELKLSYHSKDTAGRFFSSFLEAYFKQLAALQLAPLILWTRRMRAGQFLYHCGVCLDGGRARSLLATKHLALAEICWAQTLGIASAKDLVDLHVQDSFGNPRQNGTVIKKNFADNFWGLLLFDQWLRYIVNPDRIKGQPWKRIVHRFGAVWPDERSGCMISCQWQGIRGRYLPSGNGNAGNNLPPQYWLSWVGRSNCH